MNPRAGARKKPTPPLHPPPPSGTLPEAAEALEADLRKIVAKALHRFGEEVEAVALFGSYATGEGAVLADVRGIEFLEPYRIALFLPRGAAPGALKEWSKRTGRGLHNEILETVLLRPQKVHAESPRLLLLDLRESGKILWGNGGILATMRGWGVEKVPLAEAEARVLAGAKTLLTAFPHFEAGERPFRLRARAELVLMAPCEALCLLRRNYPPSRRAKCRILRDEFSWLDTFNRAVRDALDFLRAPQRNVAFNLEEWLSRKDAFLEGAIHFFNLLYGYGKGFRGVVDFGAFLIALRPGPETTRGVAALVLLAAAGEGGYDEDLVREAGALLLPGEETLEWEELRKNLLCPR